MLEDWNIDLNSDKNISAIISLSPYFLHYSIIPTFPYSISLLCVDQRGNR